MRRSEDIRENLGRAVLLIRGRQATSRRKIADCLTVSPTTAGEYVGHLIDRGYVRESGVEKGGPGRPKRSLATLPDAGWFGGVEFNAERVQAVRLDFSGVVRATAARPLPPRAPTRVILREVSRAVEHVARQAVGPLLALGVGAPGVVDPDRGVGIEYAFVDDWQDVPVGAILEARWNVPITLENNLRAIAYAERWLGGGRHFDTYVILGPRSGFGVAIATCGRVFAGGHHAAGEIGRWPHGRVALHDVLSASAVWRRLTNAAARGGLPADLGRAIAHAAASHPRRLASVVTDFADVMARLHLMLDAEAYFLHGPLTTLGAEFCDAIARRAGELTPSLASRPPVIVPSTLGDDAGSIGAGCHAMERWAPAAG